MPLIFPATNDMVSGRIAWPKAPTRYPANEKYMLVPNNSKRYPASGGKVTNEIINVVTFLNFEAKCPVVSTTTNAMNQCGIPINEDKRLENPAPVKMRLENVWRPPFGT